MNPNQTPLSKEQIEAAQFMESLYFAFLKESLRSHTLTLAFPLPPNYYDKEFSFFHVIRAHTSTTSLVGYWIRQARPKINIISGGK